MDAISPKSSNFVCGTGNYSILFCRRFLCEIALSITKVVITILYVLMRSTTLMEARLLGMDDGHWAHHSQGRRPGHRSRS